MRILIDMQGAQSSGSRNRGIGRYTNSLIKEIISNKGEDQIDILFNGSFPESIYEIRENFGHLLTDDHFHIWYPLESSKFLNENIFNREASELLLEACVARLNPDIILITSLFEGLTDNAVTSVNKIFQNHLVAVILYDLIPFIYKDKYLSNPIVYKWYESKLNFLKKSNLQLSISESSKQESIKYLETNPYSIVNISTAADDHFKPFEIKTSAKQSLLKKYNILKSFVLYTGGIDFRKNIEGLINAYAMLDQEFRRNFQLVIVCSINNDSRKQLLELGQTQGLKEQELIFTGFVPENDLVNLYNLCELFVFPSIHEGFGLPALEAMCCGAAVIGSNTSSLPEVIGHADALFNPNDPKDIKDKIQQTLSDQAFKKSLQSHSLKQSKLFSWKHSAKIALDAIRKTVNDSIALSSNDIHSKKDSNNKPLLAYVSPLPPQKSGIAFYSAELLQYLGKHYKIHVISNTEEVNDPWVSANCELKTVEWFENNSFFYERVIYHFGNSDFHWYMYSLLQKIPGLVVLHDFFLSNSLSHLSWSLNDINLLVNGLLKNHGYYAVKELGLFEPGEIEKKYPCSYSVINNALGVIFHSNYSINLAKQWYGEYLSPNFHYVPLLSLVEKRSSLDRAKSREALNINKNDFLICSFGLVAQTKLNDRLIDAFLTKIHKLGNVKLVFVGEVPELEYKHKLLSKMSKVEGQVQITGWVDDKTYRLYTMAADLAIQLRKDSRGETSRAVLDCMRRGLPVIVNNCGPMSEIPNSAAIKLPYNFKDSELTNAILSLYDNKDYLEALSNKALEYINQHHEPELCATRYRDLIEKYYNKSKPVTHKLLKEITELKSNEVNDIDYLSVAAVIDKSLPLQINKRQIFIDISTLKKIDARTGIQRVVRTIINLWLNQLYSDYVIEPVYADDEKTGFFYARQFIMKNQGLKFSLEKDELITYNKGDIFIGLDLSHSAVINQNAFLNQMKNFGIKIYFVVYDLLPIEYPEFFWSPEVSDLHTKWANLISQYTGVFCISKTVAIKFKKFINSNLSVNRNKLKIETFSLGCDQKDFSSNVGLPENSNELLKKIKSKITLLMVGTIEPRKGHKQVLDAFKLLSHKNNDIILLIIGKIGWGSESIIEDVKSDSLLEKNIFLLNDVSDEFLDQIYISASALIAASYDEGLGLPVIEAANHNLPIIARDTEIFREVCNDAAFYFKTKEPEELAKTILEWIDEFKINKHPKSNSIVRVSWADSANELLKLATK